MTDTMNMQRFLKRIHIAGTLWFIICAAALLVITLRQAGVQWWVIFSLSGYGVVLGVFLLAVYLFALFRGVVRAQFAQEHPLSTTPAYLLLYDASPFLGAAAGLLCITGIYEPAAIVRIIAEGTLVMTFVIWVVVDSGVGLIESVLPQSVRHRNQRLAKIKAEKTRIQQENAALLTSLQKREQDLKRTWDEQFRDAADELAALFCGTADQLHQIQAKTTDLGAKAWQMGQMACMQFVHKMICDRLGRNEQDRCVDYAAMWWDGIGTWRRPKSSALLAYTKSLSKMPTKE